MDPDLGPTEPHPHPFNWPALNGGRDGRKRVAVAAAYGWPADLSDEDILARLFALNQERAAAGR